MFALALTTVLAACTAPSDAQVRAQPVPAAQTARVLDRDQALALARTAAKSRSYDLSKYELSTFGDETLGGSKEFGFSFRCKGTAPPGCGFLAVVDRKTGAVEILPGM